MSGKTKRLIGKCMIGSVFGGLIGMMLAVNWRLALQILLIATVIGLWVGIACVFLFAKDEYKDDDK